MTDALAKSELNRQSQTLAYLAGDGREASLGARVRDITKFGMCMTFTLYPASCMHDTSNKHEKWHNILGKQLNATAALKRWDSKCPNSGSYIIQMYNSIGLKGNKQMQHIPFVKHFIVVFGYWISNIWKQLLAMKKTRSPIVQNPESFNSLPNQD
jgi:hypothetical protein